jgi:LysM repeat protein
METYIIQPGDSLWKVAQKHKIDLSELLAANPQIHDPNNIVGGTAIFLPIRYATGKKQEEGAGEPFIYLAQGGESLAQLSQRYHISRERLTGANMHLDNRPYLFAGDRVFIPGPERFSEDCSRDWESSESVICPHCGKVIPPKSRKG